MSITYLSDKRPSVFYTVHIEHKWDGTLIITVEDVSDDPRSRKSVSDALLQASIAINSEN